MRGESMAEKRHYKWWGYIKAIIREYPRSRSSELSGVELREHEAVKKAVDETVKMDGGANRLKVISMVHWERTRTLEGAALATPCSRSWAAKWQRDFFEETARNRDLLDGAGPSMFVRLVRARWICTNSIADPFCEVFRCSNCGAEDENYGRYDFCPWCGAKMDLKQ